MTIKRFSSRTQKLDKDFLAKALDGASKYFRIAGYFRSSIFELVGEKIAKISEVKILCNSELDLIDFQVATGRNRALKERWNDGVPLPETIVAEISRVAQCREVSVEVLKPDEIPVAALSEAPIYP